MHYRTAHKILAMCRTGRVAPIDFNDMRHRLQQHIRYIRRTRHVPPRVEPEDAFVCRLTVDFDRNVGSADRVSKTWNGVQVEK